MSNTLHKLNIDLTKITGAKVITGKDQIQYLAIDIAKSGIYYQGKGAYLNLDMRENKDGEDQYGNSHMLTISPTKEQIDAALRHIDEESTMQDMAILKRSKTSAANILSAAYRELLAENDDLKEDLHNRIVESFLP
jgi:hypothetical protein